jgi:ribosome-binding factor A
MIRRDRVASVLVREISDIVMREIKDPRIGFITITSVDLSPDLKSAKVYFSCLGDKPKSLQTLTHAKGFIRSSLAHRMRLRTVPELDFEIDNSYEHGKKIDELFEKISPDNKEE